MNRHHLTAAALLAAFAASNSIGQTTVPGDVVVAPGGTLIINDDTTYTGTLTIGAGAQVVVDTGYQINIADGATLTINGTDAEPVVFFPINGSWDGLKLLDGSTADMSYAYITDVQQYGIVADDADVSSGDRPPVAFPPGWYARGRRARVRPTHPDRPRNTPDMLAAAPGPRWCSHGGCS